MTTRGQRLYDWWSRHWTARRLLYGIAFFGRESAFRRRGVAALDLHPGETVLELGCGPGTNFRMLREAVGPDGRVAGVDYSPGMVARAHETAAEWENVHAVHGDATRLPVAADAVDAAYAAMSLSAMPDAGAVLSEARRVLRPDGRLAVLDAQPFQSLLWRPLNPLLSVLFSLTTDWNPEVDLPAALRAAFPAVDVDLYYGGSLFVAAARTDGG